ncbi:MAG TPA: ATP-binding protein, partial [Terriglobales bacterium]|nr:ATP-binding protein [Terriglobales bacterium]
PFEVEARLRRADGQYRRFLLRGMPLCDELGNVIRWNGTSTDIEDRKRTEEALQQARAELAHVTRVMAMGELAAAIAHEVNQPLAAIVTNANFCLRQLANATRNLEKLREAIAEIANDGTRASTVISRIRALLQRGAPERVELDINQIIQEVNVLLRDELTRNRVSLRADLAADLPRVSGDPIQLQQVLINLVMNGIDAMRTLTDRKRELLIKSAKNHNEVFIQVQDSGEGLDPQQAERIFQPFFTTKPEGIGMGLSISRSIVESHGGRLWAESGSKGARFQFTLPTK